MHSNYSHPHPLLSPSWSYQFPHPHNKSLFHVHVFLFYFVLWPIEFSQCLLCGQGLELPIGDGWLANSVWVHKLKTMVPLPLESSSRPVVQRVVSHEPLPIQEWLLIGPIMRAQHRQTELHWIHDWSRHITPRSSIWSLPSCLLAFHSLLRCLPELYSSCYKFLV